MVHFVWSLLLLSFAQSSPALEVYRDSLNAAAERWTFFYNEDKKFILESISLDHDGWPQLDRRSVFDHEIQARIALTEAAQGKIRARRLPTAGQVLRGRPGQSLWRVTNTWSWEWEMKYSEWVKTELDKYWWLRHGLATDCADVAYSAKWIFARNNGLPMANRLANGQWFTQDSVKRQWENLPTSPEWHKDKKFLAALNYMLGFVFTHTLWNDSYPIAMTPESLIPGAHHLSLHSRSGHTQFVYRVGLRADEIPVLTLNSTVPREKRELMEFIFFSEKADPASDAFLRIRWPDFKNGVPGLKDPTDMPFYSVEQFDPHFVRAPRSSFWEEVFYRLNPAADFDLIGQRVVGQVVDLLRARIPVVEDGYKVCHAHPCVKGTPAWEAWSTPSRDDRIRASIDTYYSLSQFITRPDLIEPLLQAPLLVQEGYTFTTAMLMRAFRESMFSSDPNVEPVSRWGVHPRGVSEKIRQYFSDGLGEREAIIHRPHNCVDENCVFGSDRFVRASSKKVDQNLTFARGSVERYCANFGPDMCQELERYLRAISLTADGRSLSVWDWLKEVLFFNSDPRLPSTLRFESYRRHIPHYAFDSAPSGEVSSFDHRLFYDSSQLFVLHGAEFRPWPLPVGERMETLDAAVGWIWTSMGQFLIARAGTGGLPYRFALPSAVTRASALGGHVVALADRTVYLLRLQGGAIGELARFADATYSMQRNGFALISQSDGESQLVDLMMGAVVRLAEPPEKVFDIRRFDTDYFIKYRSAADKRVICRMLAADHSTADLTSTGNCVNYAPATQVGIFEVNRRAIKRTYRNGTVVSEEDVGDLGEYYSDRLLTTSDRGRLRHFCFGSENMDELQSLPGVLGIATCNDRYVIEAVTTTEWRVRDRHTGQVKLRAESYIDFASDWPQEHFVIGVNFFDEKPLFGLLDVERPDRFSLLTGDQMFDGNVPYERASGLMLMKDDQALWIDD